MYEFIAKWMPRRLVLLAFERLVAHCQNSTDPEIQHDALSTTNSRAQWLLVISGEVEENR